MENEREYTQQAERDDAATSRDFSKVPNICDDNALGTFVTRACKQHNVDPDTVIVYRDGVSDCGGDYDQLDKLVSTKHVIWAP